jgi:hypothetical protein
MAHRTELRAALLEVLMEEYGADEETWTALRSLDRVVDKVASVTPQVTIKTERDQPAECVVTYRGNTIFDGVSRDALMSLSRAWDDGAGAGADFSRGAVEELVNPFEEHP